MLPTITGRLRTITGRLRMITGRLPTITGRLFSSEQLFTIIVGNHAFLLTPLTPLTPEALGRMCGFV